MNGQTRGVIATWEGKPIIAYYTSTCGGRTENVENIFESHEPYLRGVECSLEGRQQFEPFLIKSTRETPKIEREGNAELVRRAAQGDPAAVSALRTSDGRACAS